MLALDAIFATLKTIIDDETSTISSTISLRVAWPLGFGSPKVHKTEVKALPHVTISSTISLRVAWPLIIFVCL